MAFSAADAALEGFRIARERPKAMLIWAFASLVISILSSVGLVLFFGDTMNQFMAMDDAATSDPTQAMAMIGQVAALYLFLIPVVLLIFSIFTAAVYRAVLRPSDSAFGYLRLGADEFRLAVVLLVLFLVGMVVSFAAVFVVAIIGAIVGVGLMGAAGDGGAGVGGAILAFILIALLYLALLVLSLAFWTKMSFAGPMTFAERRIRIFESWRATKGHFWSLFGCYLMAAVLGIVVSLLGSIISFAVMIGLGGGAGGGTDVVTMLTSMQPDYVSLAAYFTPAIIANLVVASIFSALTYAIFLAPPAVAYRDLIAKTGPGVSETFG